MTDRELLDKSREILSAGYGGTSRELAYFVADMLDDGTVTKEALLAMGFKHTSDNIYQHGIYFVELYPDCYCLGIKHPGYGKHYIHGQLFTIGQLRCLLRGLGVGV